MLVDRYLYLVVLALKDIFQDEICKMSLQISINRRINFDDTEH